MTILIDAVVSLGESIKSYGYEYFEGTSNDVSTSTTSKSFGWAYAMPLLLSQCYKSGIVQCIFKGSFKVSFEVSFRHLSRYLSRYPAKYFTKDLARKSNYRADKYLDTCAIIYLLRYI